MVVVARALQIGFPFLSLCVAAIVLAIVLDASIVQAEETTLDLSRGRDVAFVLSMAVLAGSAYVLVRSIRTVKKESADEGDSEELPTEGATEDAPPSDGTAVDYGESIGSLPEDELELYQMIADAGGEMLQMNIVSSKVFSKAKVTRLLNKLEGRGLVVRERHGMTNRIRILR
jgi:uncharacterized membrane protein